MFTPACIPACTRAAKRANAENATQRWLEGSGTSKKSTQRKSVCGVPAGCLVAHGLDGGVAAAVGVGAGHGGRSGEERTGADTLSGAAPGVSRESMPSRSKRRDGVNKSCGKEGTRGRDARRRVGSAEGREGMTGVGRGGRCHVARRQTATPCAEGSAAKATQRPRAGYNA